MRNRIQVDKELDRLCECILGLTASAVTSDSNTVFTNKSLDGTKNTFVNIPYSALTGTPTIPTNYITTNTSQTGLTGDKTTSGLWTFTAPFSTGQATFGSLGQGGKISLIEGTSGTSAFTISYFNSTSLGAIIQGNSSSGLVVRNTGATGYVGLEATGASGFLNFISGNAQAARLFANGNLRIGASAVDSGNKLQVDGNSGFVGGVTVAGNIAPDANNTRDLGSAINNFAMLRANAIGSNGILIIDSNGGNSLQFRNGSTNNIYAGHFSTTRNVFFQSPSTIPTDDLSGLQLKHSITASSGVARGMNITSTLTSSANNDVLVGLDINPTFVNGGSHTGVANAALRVNGFSYFQDVLPRSNFTNAFGSSTSVWLTGYIGTVFSSFIRAYDTGGIALRNNANLTGLLLNNSARILIQNGGTFTDSGEQLQVVGSVKLDGAVTATGLLTATGGVSSSTYGATGVTRISFNNTSETGNINMANYGSGLAGALVGITPTLNGASVSQKCVSILPTINQSGTSAYTILYASVYEQATGSGTKNLIDVGTNTAANNGGTHTNRFSVSNIGKVNSVDNFETTVIGKGFILKSPDGTRYRITVANGGAISTVLA